MLPSFDLHAKKLKILINSFPEFFFSIYWWTWKTNNSLKNCWSGPIKNNIILKFTMLYFFKKIKKNTCKYHYKNLDDIIHSSWDVEQNILKLVILVHFLPFYPQKPLKSKLWKMEIFAGDIILQMWTKNHNHVWFLRYGVRQAEFLVILGHFLPF